MTAALPRRRLGPAGPEVGAIGLGCMGMSWAYAPGDRDERRSTEVIRRAAELGVTMFDTADVYGPFTNEELVGAALEPIRDEVFLATKTGLVVAAAPPAAPDYVFRNDGRPEHVRAALEASLRRLRSDRVDLFYLHRVDPAVPIEETWGAMAELVAAGKALSLGLSEASVEELDRAQAIHPVAALQSELSVWNREPLAAVLPWCERHGAGFVAYSPLGRGYLTGRWTQATYEEGDFRAASGRFADEARAANRVILDCLDGIAAKHGASTVHVAIAWVLAQGEGVVPIPGTRRPANLEENLGAAGLRLDAEDLARIDALPPPVGERARPAIAAEQTTNESEEQA